MDNQEIERALGEIINSTTLSKSQHSKQLLEYLVKATQEKKDIKEYTIAKDVFNKESDTGVRAYIHNLRKKLDEYYSGEGKNSESVLSIPKGQYYVQIYKREKEPQELTSDVVKPTLNKKIFTLPALIIIIILSAATLFFYLTKKDKGPEDSVIWGDVIASETPLLIVVGDHYFFGSKILTGKYGLVRDFHIHSEKDLEDWIKYNKTSLRDSITKINYTYTTKQGPMSVFQISPYLKNHQNIQLVLSSELTYEQIKNNNIIFLGKYVTLGILKDLVDNRYFHEDRKAGDFSYIQKDTIIKPNFVLSPSYKEDYPIALKFKTPYKKTVLMFVSADDPGNAAVINYFLNSKNLSFLEEKFHLSEKENSFSALFKVVGLERTDYSIDFIAGEKIVK